METKYLWKMMTVKNIYVLLFSVFFVNLLIGQEEFTTKEEIEEIPQEEIEADPRYKSGKNKKRSKKLPFSFHTFQYEFISNGNKMQYVTIKNKAKKAEKTIVNIPLGKYDYMDVIPYNYGYEYHTAKSHKNDVERHYHENYIIYQNKNKEGLVLDANVIPAQFDTIGRPYLVRGEKPMMLVAKKKRKNYKWGIIKSDGSYLLPVEYDEIIILTEMDVARNSKGSNGMSESVWYDSSSILFTDGLYHDHKIIVRKNNKYGLYNANGEKELEAIYDEIQVDTYFQVYVLKKDNESSYLIAKPSEVGVWGTNKLIEKNTNTSEYLKIAPSKEYEFFIKNGLIYIKHSYGVVEKINRHRILKKIEKK